MRLVPFIIDSVVRVVALVFFGVRLLSIGTAADESLFVGAETCRACHPVQFAAQSQSGHARSLVSGAGHPLSARVAASRTFSLNGFRYDFLHRDRGLAFRVRAGPQVRELPVDWAFGAGDQAVTFVSRLDEEHYVELRASYYSALDAVALTPGHQSYRPRDLPGALGVRYKTFSPRSEILSCFGCHSTGMPSLGGQLEIRPAELGVRCEACHGPGRKHVNLISGGDIDGARRAIGNPARLKASALMQFCGECHRPPASEGIAIDWSDAWNVRHQPVYLSESACFQRSPGGLSCANCHDPHERLRRGDPAHYNRRCVSCHSTAAHPPAKICRAEAGCASCHMPPVQPQPGLTFHNHWIGVYRAGDPLRPQR
jgi:Cytochrome c554 and c-prime